jgi:Resolvase, N terminal domain
VGDLGEFFLYRRKSNGRKAVPRQRAITRAYLTKLGGRVAREFTDADGTAFGKIDGEQPKRDGFASVLAVLRSRPGLKVAARHADRLTGNPGDTGELIRVGAAGVTWWRHQPAVLRLVRGERAEEVPGRCERRRVRGRSR